MNRGLGVKSAETPMTRTNREVYQVSLSRGDTHKSRSVQLPCMILASFRHVAVLNIKEKELSGSLLGFRCFRL